MNTTATYRGTASFPSTSHTHTHTNLLPPPPPPHTPTRRHTEIHTQVHQRSTASILSRRRSKAAQPTKARLTRWRSQTTPWPWLSGRRTEGRRIDTQTCRQTAASEASLSQPIYPAAGAGAGAGLVLVLLVGRLVVPVVVPMVVPVVVAVLVVLVVLLLLPRVAAWMLLRTWAHPQPSQCQHVNVNVLEATQRNAPRSSGTTGRRGSCWPSWPGLLLCSPGRPDKQAQGHIHAYR